MSSPDLSKLLLAMPDPDFQLSDAERASLSPVIDPVALQTFLARVRPEHRQAILKDMNELGSGRPTAFGPMTTTIPDPEIHAEVAAIIRRPVRE